MKKKNTTNNQNRIGFEIARGGGVVVGEVMMGAGAVAVDC